MGLQLLEMSQGTCCSQQTASTSTDSWYAKFQLGNHVNVLAYLVRLYALKHTVQCTLGNSSLTQSPPHLKAYLEGRCQALVHRELARGQGQLPQHGGYMLQPSTHIHIGSHDLWGVEQQKACTSKAKRARSACAYRSNLFQGSDWALERTQRKGDASQRRPQARRKGLWHQWAFSSVKIDSGMNWTALLPGLTALLS
eukprot:1147670-Pelagomonas_calceolata.AAC.7